MTPSPSEQGVWQRLRRRRVNRTVAGYVSSTFALREAYWLLANAVGWDESTVRVLTGVLVLGLPVTVVLAWTYDVTPEGIVRTPDEDRDDASGVQRTAVRRRTWYVLCLAMLVIGFFIRSIRV